MNPILNFKAIVGVVPGYAKDNDPPMPPPTLDQALAIASGAWDKVAEEVHALVATAGLIGYVSAFFTAGKVVYRKDWGCPEGGEVSVQITGEKNPMFPAPKDTIWTLLVIETFRRVKLALGQSSLTVYLPRACVDMRNGKMTFMDEMDSEGPTVMDETDSLIPLIRNLATKDGK